MKENLNIEATRKIKKRWREYFIEFMLLFLAVFLGFFAESYREELAERKAERQLIQSFIEDLKSDTAAISRNIAFRKAKLERMDSFIYLLGSKKIKGYENQLYFLGRTFIRRAFFQPNERTISQLKNSGLFRLISNKQASDSIMAYRGLVETIIGNQIDEKNELLNSHSVINEIFNPYVFDTMVSISGIKRPINNPPLRSYDEKLQQDLAFWIHLVKGSQYITFRRLETLRNKATNTMLFLQKEYDLE